MIDIHSHNKESINGTKIFNVLSVDDFPENKDLLYSVGMHPWYLKPQLWQNDMNYYESLVSQDNVVAIGECGLDWMTHAKQDVQKTVFTKHLLWAEKYDKPIIIHCVKAFNEVIAICKKANIKQARLIHGYNNNLKIAEQLINAGFYLSFGKALLDSGSNAAAALKITPLPKIFLETDDSDVKIEAVYEKAAELLSLSQNDLRLQLTANFNAIFKK